MTPNTPAGISFITFTYNDHDLTGNLLTYVGNMHIPLNTLLVVDDASPTPFTLLPSHPNASILRLPEHKGIPQAKKHGFGSIEGHTIFSLDADIRPHKKWLLSSLPFLTDPSVGLVGATCAYRRSMHHLGRALFTTTPPEKSAKEAPFVGGGCWLFRKEVWDAVGGLDDMPDHAFEDVFFCQKLRSLGYRIIKNNQYPVYQTRNLHRATHAKRTVRYYSPSIATIINIHGFQKYLDDGEKLLATPLHYFQTNKDPILCYVFVLENLLMFHTMLAKATITPSQIGPCFSLTKVLTKYPQTLALLLADIQKAEVDVTDLFLPEGLSTHLNTLKDAGVFQALEDLWVERYRDEDKVGQFDYHYTEDLREELP